MTLMEQVSKLLPMPVILPTPAVNGSDITRVIITTLYYLSLYLLSSLQASMKCMHNATASQSLLMATSWPSVLFIYLFIKRKVRFEISVARVFSIQCLSRPPINAGRISPPKEYIFVSLTLYRTTLGASRPEKRRTWGKLARPKSTLSSTLHIMIMQVTCQFIARKNSWGIIGRICATN